jgi:hypothetical protein
MSKQSIPCIRRWDLFWQGKVTLADFTQRHILGDLRENSIRQQVLVHNITCLDSMVRGFMITQIIPFWYMISCMAKCSMNQNLISLLKATNGPGFLRWISKSIPKWLPLVESKVGKLNHLVGGSVVRAWNQGVWFFYDLRFEPCNC